jgi:iron complex outermembrane recepter protein
MKKFFILLYVLFLFIISIKAQSEKKNVDTLKYELEQVTISATRYPEKVIEVPYAVSIIPLEDLLNTKGYGLDEVLIRVPGVLAQSRDGNQDVRIVIRGFGARGSGDRSNSGTTRGIRVMLDGIPETEPDGRTSFDNIDLSLSNDIDVIRSNSSSLWGNASGGIINVSTVPKFSTGFAFLGGMWGTFGLQKYILRTGAIVGMGRLSGTFAYTNFDGWRDHSASSRSIANIGIISQLGDQTELGAYIVGTSNLFHIPGPLTEEQYNTNPQQANPVYQARDERRNNKLMRIGVTLDHKLNQMHEFSGMVFANPKSLQRSERNTFRDFTRYHIGGNFMYTNNYNFSDDVPNKLILGVDEAYQDGAVLFYSLSPTNGRGDELRDNKREGANNFGAFIQDEVKFEEKWSLILGGRYDDVTYYSESFIESGYGLQQKSFTHFTPKAGLTYLFSPTHSIYANLGGGVEVPAGNETDPAGTYGQDSIYLLNPLLEPITSTTIEAGTKQLMFIGNNSFLQSISYDVALYYIVINNDIIPYRGGRFYFTAGETNRMGIETGVNLDFDYGFSFDGSFTYSMNKYQEYTVDSVHYGAPGSYADYGDNKVAGIPDYFYYAAITYEPIGLKGLFLCLSINGTGDYFVDDANTITVPSFNVFGVTLGIKDQIRLNDHIFVSGFVTVNNIADETYVGSAFVNPDVVNGVPIYIEPGLPRNVVASISLGFE